MDSGDREETSIIRRLPKGSRDLDHMRTSKIETFIILSAIKIYSLIAINQHVFAAKTQKFETLEDITVANLSFDLLLVRLEHLRLRQKLYWFI